MTHYVLNQAWEREKERLGSLQGLVDPVTIRHLETLGIQKGWRCAEVGAGVGSIAHWLCECVGDQGHTAWSLNKGVKCRSHEISRRLRTSV